MEEATSIDRIGLSVLEYLLREVDDKFQGFEFGFKEKKVVACWNSSAYTMVMYACCPMLYPSAGCRVSKPIKCSECNKLRR
jgi:hypothetical protein